MTFVIEDRVAEYNTQLAAYNKLIAMDKVDVMEMHHVECELQRVKLDQKRERLEALGVIFDGTPES